MAAEQQWLRRLAEIGEPTLARLMSRRTELALAAVLTALFMAAGGLSLRAALLGMLAVAAWAALWPANERTAGAGTRAHADAAADSDRLWRLVVDAVPDPAVALNPSGQILHANSQAEAQFGGRRRGGHVASMSRDPELLAAVDKALTEREACSVELHERVPVERRLLATVVPLQQAPAGSPALLIFFRDLTEQDRLTRMRADFVANASHELRTPLASLRGYVETLRGAAKDDPAARERFLGTMQEQAERMSRLVDDLLSLSRVEMREYLPPTGSAELGGVLGDVLRALEPLANRAGARLTLAGVEGEAIVRGERDELVAVFQNLIQNAIKYGRQKVEVRLAREPAAAGRPARLRVDVSDDGPGIAAQHLPRLTERFYRVNVAASREKGGTGLGLAIVKHILNRHRGELLIASRVGEGSTFTVLLPAAQE